MQTDRAWINHVLAYEPVGSRRTCKPPPINTDDDYLVLVKDHETFRAYVMDELGFYLLGSVVVDAAEPLDTKDRFSSYMLSETNLIVTQDQSFYQKFIAATSVAKRLNLLQKSDRIALFQAVLYGNPC